MSDATCVHETMTKHKYPDQNYHHICAACGESEQAITLKKVERRLKKLEAVLEEITAYAHVLTPGELKYIVTKAMERP